jgi:hypothetical protein
VAEPPGHAREQASRAGTSGNNARTQEGVSQIAQQEQLGGACLALEFSLFHGQQRAL